MAGAHLRQADGEPDRQCGRPQQQVLPDFAAPQELAHAHHCETGSGWGMLVTLLGGHAICGTEQLPFCPGDERSSQQAMPAVFKN